MFILGSNVGLGSMHGPPVGDRITLVPDKRQKLTLEYSGPSTRRQVRFRPGLISFALCLLQWPWYAVANAIAWGMIWGDNSAEGSGRVFAQLLFSAPSIAAVLLGLWAIGRHRLSLDLILGAIAVLTGVALMIWTIRQPLWW